MGSVAKLFACVAFVLCCCAPASKSADVATQDWRQILKDRIPLFGHRNWIVVADSAYPAQSGAGIETVVANASEFDVLRAVMADISASRHVRAIPYTDRELKFVSDDDAPGANGFRQQLSTILPDAEAHSLLHEEIIKNLDEAGRTFRILIIKTNMTIPYTSVFLQLNCAYWSDAAEQKLRAAMAH